MPSGGLASVVGREALPVAACGVRCLRRPRVQAPGREDAARRQDRDGTGRWDTSLPIDDPSSPAASAALTPVFAVLTVIGVVVLGLFLRPGPRTGEADQLARSGSDE